MQTGYHHLHSSPRSCCGYSVGLCITVFYLVVTLSYICYYHANALAYCYLLFTGFALLHMYLRTEGGLCNNCILKTLHIQGPTYFFKLFHTTTAYLLWHEPAATAFQSESFLLWILVNMKDVFVISVAAFALSTGSQLKVVLTHIVVVFTGIFMLLDCLCAVVWLEAASLCSRKAKCLCNFTNTGTSTSVNKV